MNDLKINIIFPFSNQPYGGGNQFLLALKKRFIERNIYTNNENEANIFLFNSFQNADKLLKIKRKYQNKLFIHRIDGPISLYRHTKNKFIDKIIYDLNKIADASIFQSNFSLKENKKLGLLTKQFETIIYNAPDNSIFYPKKKRKKINDRKIKLISCSWSKNIMKGFDSYRYLDNALDFSQYEYIFTGRSPYKFKNIKIIPPQPSALIADYLQKSDIFITASYKDPCSNSLIEAISCGLPSLVRNDGGHPELIKKGGELFNTDEEIILKLKKIKNNYSDYYNHLSTYNINNIASQYINFINQVFLRKKNNTDNIKFLNYLKLKFNLFLWAK